jgi:transcriptional regulator with XRE-family HTH domain
MSFIPAQCRAARGLLGWSQARLATASQLAAETIADFERQSGAPEAPALAAARAALEAAGVEFTNGGQPGVRLAGPPPGGAKDAAAAAGDEAALPEIPDDAEPYDGAPV